MIRNLWLWAREVVWLAVLAVFALLVALMFLLLGFSWVWVLLFVGAAVTFAILSLRNE